MKRSPSWNVLALTSDSRPCVSVQTLLSDLSLAGIWCWFIYVWHLIMTSWVISLSCRESSYFGRRSSSHFFAFCFNDIASPSRLFRWLIWILCVTRCSRNSLSPLDLLMLHIYRLLAPWESPEIVLCLGYLVSVDLMSLSAVAVCRTGLSPSHLLLCMSMRTHNDGPAFCLPAILQLLLIQLMQAVVILIYPISNFVSVVRSVPFLNCQLPSPLSGCSTLRFSLFALAADCWQLNFPWFFFGSPSCRVFNFVSLCLGS